MAGTFQNAKFHGFQDVIEIRNHDGTTVQSKSPKGLHLKTKTRHTNCTKLKDLDLAHIQTKAFKFMVLQRPEIQSAVPVLGKPAKASFMPKNKLPSELYEAMRANDQIKHLINIPEKMLGKALKPTNVHSRFSPQAGEPIEEEPLPIPQSNTSEDIF